MEHTDSSAARPQVVARDLFEQAFACQRRREFDKALELYRESVRACPTAEAYCFMGWSHSFLGQYEKAIACCHKAIEIDPELGNPYNDIGAYLIELRRPDEAITWLRRATRAPRYDCYHYPWYNMGKVFEQQGKWMRAKDCYARSLRAQSGYPLALRALVRVVGKMN